MISVLITGEVKLRQNYINDFCNEYNISQFDRIIIQPDDTKKTNTLGIEQIRSAQEKIYQKPLQSNEKVIVFSAKEITVEAQNALLKILEEPPNSTTIIISLEQIISILPTILSRCKVIKFEQQKNDEVQQYPSMNTIQSSTTGDKLKYAQDLGKTREEALAFLLYSINSLRIQMHEAIMDNHNNELVSNNRLLLEKLNSVYATISTTNINPRFALEITFLSL